VPKVTLTIRPAVPGDAGLVHSFVRQLADYEKLLHEVEGTEADLDAALFGPNPRVFCEIAAWDGVPAGQALWFYSFSTFSCRAGIYLEDLFVDPARRGRGIGRALLRQLAKRCVDEDLKCLDWQVLDWNTPSIAFYESIGAVARREWISKRLSGDALTQLAEIVA
jgi:GNAT superfamily N-acetyltransferase